MRFVNRVKFCVSRQSSLLLGCCLGITLSLLLLPAAEEHCPWQQNVPPSTHLSELSTHRTTVDEYQPILNLNNKPRKNSHFEKPQVPRSRYYSTELGIRDKLFVGVLSTSQTISTLGSALNRTLSKHASRVLFFLQGSEAGDPDANVVAFAQRREILAPFDVLRHVSENHLEEYDFFFFARDTTHVRGRKLSELASSISVARSVHLGRPLDPDSLYCSLEAGILLSRSVLLQTVTDLEWCVQHAFSESDSDNFGRCILHGTDRPCASSVQGYAYISHQVSKHDSLEASIKKSSWPKDLKNALTIYSVSSQEQHFLIHHYFCQQELIDNQRELREIQNKISNASLNLPQNVSEISWPVGIEPPFKPHGRFDVLPWIYFNTTHNFWQSELRVISEIEGLNELEIQDLLRCTVHWAKVAYDDRYIYQRLVNGYKRFDPTRGTEYMLDMVFLEDATGRETLKRIAAVRPLNEVEIIPVPFVTEHTRVVLLVVVKASDRNEAPRFLEDYAKACIEKQDSTVMLLVFLYGPQDPGKGEKEDIFRPVKDLVSGLVIKYRSSGAKIAWFSVKTTGEMPPHFAVIDLVSRKLSAESLLLLCHVGMEVRPEYINRVRMNTILRAQVFFPIPFRQYHPSLAYKHITLPDIVEVKKDLGRFDPGSYEHASFYLSDYLTARKRLEAVIPTVKSDRDLKNERLYGQRYDLFEIFLRSKLHIMRAVEPDLRIGFRFDACDFESNVGTYQECLRSREENLGTKSQMAAAVLSHSELHAREGLPFNDIL